ncbi:TasA family protein [Pseudoneobacillus sp. C159]
MSIKKKLTIGAMSAALGLSLVAGGTWAAFNDIEQTSASFAAGTLNLTLAEVANGGPKEFKISNLKPGDKMTRSIRLVNDGTLAIKDVLLSIDGINFTDYIPVAGQPGFGDTDTWGSNTGLEYLDQFNVKVVSVGDQGGGGYPIDIIVQDITLKDLYLATSSETTLVPADVTAARAKLNDTAYVKAGYFDDNRLKLTPRAQDYTTPGLGDQYAGIPVGIAHNVKIEIEFNNDLTLTPGTLSYIQNKFQGDKVDFNFTLEARQWDGIEVLDSDVQNGVVESNKKHNNGRPIQP